MYSEGGRPETRGRLGPDHGILGSIFTLAIALNPLHRLGVYIRVYTSLKPKPFMPWQNSKVLGLSVSDTI